MYVCIEIPRLKNFNKMILFNTLECTDRYYILKIYLRKYTILQV